MLDVFMKINSIHSFFKIIYNYINDLVINNNIIQMFDKI